MQNHQNLVQTIVHIHLDMTHQQCQSMLSQITKEIKNHFPCPLFHFFNKIKTATFIYKGGRGIRKIIKNNDPVDLSLTRVLYKSTVPRQTTCQGITTVQITHKINITIQNASTLYEVFDAPNPVAGFTKIINYSDKKYKNKKLSNISKF